MVNGCVSSDVVPVTTANHAALGASTTSVQLGRIFGGHGRLWASRSARWVTCVPGRAGDANRFGNTWADTHFGRRSHLRPCAKFLFVFCCFFEPGFTRMRRNTLDTRQVCARSTSKHQRSRHLLSWMGNGARQHHGGGDHKEAWLNCTRWQGAFGAVRSGPLGSIRGDYERPPRQTGNRVSMPRGTSTSA